MWWRSWVCSYSTKAEVPPRARASAGVLLGGGRAAALACDRQVGGQPFGLWHSKGVYACAQACYSVAAAQRRSRVSDGSAASPGEGDGHALHLDPGGVQVYGVLDQPDMQARSLP